MNYLGVEYDDEALDRMVKGFAGVMEQGALDHDGPGPVQLDYLECVITSICMYYQCDPETLNPPAVHRAAEKSILLMVERGSGGNLELKEIVYCIIYHYENNESEAKKN